MFSSFCNLSANLTRVLVYFSGPCLVYLVYFSGSCLVYLTWVLVYFSRSCLVYSLVLSGVWCLSGLLPWSVALPQSFVQCGSTLILYHLLPIRRISRLFTCIFLLIPDISFFTLTKCLDPKFYTPKNIKKTPQNPLKYPPKSEICTCSRSNSNSGF